MKVVIDIPTKTYERIRANGGHGIFNLCFYMEDNLSVSKAIYNGTPLPKGHGDLIDRRKVLADMSSACVTGGTRTVMQGYVARAETIIEADKEGIKDEKVWI